MPRLRRPIPFALAAALSTGLLAGGCSPAWYKQDADEQVYPLVRDRQRETVGYEPEVVADATVATEPLRRAYDILPTTVLPPLAAPPLESDVLDLRYGPLGPDDADLAPAPDDVARFDLYGGSPADGESNGPEVPAATPTDRVPTAVPTAPTDPAGGPPSGEGGPPVPAVVDPTGGDPSRQNPDRVEVPGDEDAQAEGSIRDLAFDRLVYGPEVRPTDALTLGLFDAVRFAVANNRDYRSRMEDVYLTALGVTLERHLFRPRPFAGATATINGDRQQGDLSFGGVEISGDGDYRAALTTVVDAGVRQQLPYGGEVVARALVSFVDTIQGNLEGGETAALALSASIPLLRGAGLVNLEPLIQQERQLVYAIRDFEQFRRGFAVNIASQYFQLLTRQQQIQNRYLRFRNAQNLLVRTEALFATGRLNALQVQRAVAQLLDAENGLNQTQTGYESDLDDFKIVLGSEVDRAVDVVGEEVAAAEPELYGLDPRGQRVIGLALRYRLDLQTTRDQVEDARRAVKVTENGLLPDLNLVADTGTGNRPGTAGARLDARALDYSAGVELNLPLDRLAERNNYRRSLVALQRSVRQVEDATERVKADVRSAVRGIRLARQSLAIQAKNIAVARQRLEFANELLVIGQSSDSRDVVEAQNSLLSSQDQYDQARANLQIQILVFLRDTGLLRVDPSAGTLGLAADRSAARASEAIQPLAPPDRPDPIAPVDGVPIAPEKFDGAIDAILSGE